MVMINLHDTVAEIDETGAWLTSLKDADQAVLFSRQTLMTPDGKAKLRGGCHVCLPNFGPGGVSGLAQHGFGRELDWEVVEQTESAVTLQLNNDNPTYHKMVAWLTYALGERRMTMRLTLENTGDTALPVAPAFHPYFALDANETPRLNGAELDAKNLNNAVFYDGTRQQLTTKTHTLDLTSEHLPIWAVWTDYLSDYVCVEPTHAGNAFLDNPDDCLQLLPGATADFSFSISW